MVHLGKEFFAPRGHAAADGRNHDVAREKVAGHHRVQLIALALDLGQCGRQIRVVLETVIDKDLPAVVAQWCHIQTLIRLDARHLVAAHGDKQVAFMQNFVVLQVVQQGVGHSTRLCRHENRRALDPSRRRNEHRLQKVRQPQGVRAQRFVEQAATIVPGQHQREHRRTNEQREPTTVEQLEQVGGPKGQVDHKEETRSTDAQRQRELPGIADHKEGEHRGDQHVGAHGNAVSRSQVARRLEHDHRQHDGHKQAPVHKRHVDLSGVGLAGVLHLQAWQITQLDDLLGHTECTRNQRLRGNHRGHGRQAHQRQQGPIRRHHVEGVFHGLGLGQEQSALAKIIQRQARHDHAEPGQTDGLFTKVPHVGIQRLPPRDAQDHRAENDEGGARLVPHEAQRVVRADGHQNFRMVGDVRHTQHRDGGKPDQGDGSKELTNARRATFLDPEQAEQDHQRERNHVLLESGRNDLQAFDC